MNEILQLFSSLKQGEKQHLGWLVMLSFLVSLFETVGVAAIMIFISLATNFDLLQTNRYCAMLYCICGSPGQVFFVIELGIVLFFFYCFRTIIGIWHLYLINRFAQAAYAIHAGNFFDRYLDFSLYYATTKNTAEIAHLLFNCSGHVVHVFSSSLVIVAESLTIGCIYILLFASHPTMTLALSCILGIQLWGAAKIVSRSIALAGKGCQQSEQSAIKIFNETAGNFTLIKLCDSRDTASQRFANAAQGVAAAKTIHTTMQGIPRFLFEGSGFILLVGMVLVVLYFLRDAHAVMPIVALYAISFYRLLPSINKILASYNQLIFSLPALQKITAYRCVERETFGNQVLTFTKTIEFKGVSFRYPSNNKGLLNLSFEIIKGQKVAFIGGSGAGKSTLLNLLMGLYEPDEGQIFVDGNTLISSHKKSWHKKLGYIPQNIYLFDGSVAENIVFGRPYDEQKIIRVLEQARIYDFLQERNGLATQVGEGGVSLSGGQRQRIAIARALYGDPEILILDEATAALDHVNEAIIMEELFRLSQSSGMTLIIVTHRLSVADRCDIVFVIDNEQVTRAKKITEVVQTNSFGQSNQ